MLRFGAFFFLILSCPVFARAQAPDSSSLELLAKDAMKQWQASGLAIAIVHKDRIVYAKGFGVRSLKGEEPMTAHTVFPIASCSKTITSLALAMLVDDGKLDWDDPVRKHVPFFKLADPLADANVTLRDLLCHRTGVGNHDLLWYKAPWSFEERIRKIGKVELQSSFRSSFQYQTILYGTAGYAGGKAAGASWRAVVEKRVFAPLGMKSASCVFPKDAGDLAAPHRRNAKGEIEAIARYPLDEADPAGSIHASAQDLAQFLRFQLGDGAWMGKRLLAGKHLNETHMPQMVIRREGFAKTMNPHTTQISYGLGWIVQDYRGKTMLLHGGAIDGFRAQLTLVPEEKLGIVLLNNLDGTFLNLALSNTLVDRFMGAEKMDWNRYFIDIAAKEELDKQAAAKAFRAKRQPDRLPTLPLAAYTGVYSDKAYGDCEIKVAKGRLVWHWAALACPLEHYQDDMFVANSDAIVDAPVEFAIEEGRVEAFRMLGRVFVKKD